VLVDDQVVDAGGMEGVATGQDNDRVARPHLLQTEVALLFGTALRQDRGGEGDPELVILNKQGFMVGFQAVPDGGVQHVLFHLLFLAPQHGDGTVQEETERGQDLLHLLIVFHGCLEMG
jgi:hypothetical protein